MQRMLLYKLIVLFVYACAGYLHPATTSSVPLYTFKSLEDSAINQPHETTFGINTGWSIYKDIMFPGTKIEGALRSVNRFAKGNKVLNCSITGGDAYNNLFFTSTLAKKWKGEKWYFETADKFTYSMEFYIDNLVDCDIANLSELEGLEFTFQQAMPPYSFIWGLQWSKSNVWSYWDDTKINQRARGWMKISELKACMLFKQWNKISITGHHNGEELWYDSLHLNHFSIAINKYVPKAPLPPNWAENYLQVGFQINGNKAIRRDHKNGTDPVNVYLNNVQLELRKAGD